MTLTSDIKKKLGNKYVSDILLFCLYILSLCDRLGLYFHASLYSHEGKKPTFFFFKLKAEIPILSHASGSKGLRNKYCEPCNKLPRVGNTKGNIFINISEHPQLGEKTLLGSCMFWVPENNLAKKIYK